MLLGNGLMVSEGDLWKTQRQAITPRFHREVVAAMTDTINKSNLELLERWLQAADRGAPVNVTRDVSKMVLEVILSFVFGDDVEAVSPAFQLLVDENARDLNFMHLFADLRHVLAKLILRRRDHDIDARDALGFLMGFRFRQTEAPMPDARIINECLTMIVAGHETTASTLNFVWYLLTQHPSADAELARDVAVLAPQQALGFDECHRLVYVYQVIEETMRLYPPGWLLTRKAMAPDCLGGFEVPQFSEVYLSPYLIQRHPDLWKNPNEFDVKRFAEEAPLRAELSTFPFSAGPRNCIGELLARTEMQIHVAQVGRCLRFTYNGDVPPLEAQVNLRTRDDLIMQPHRRE